MLVALLLFPLLTHAGELQARLQWSQRAELSTPVSGRIDRVLVDVGSRVDQGAELLRLDQRGFQARVKKARANLVEAKEAMAEAKREVERAQELFDRTVLSVHELQLTKIEFTRAQSAFKRAEAQLAEAELALEYSVIHAPFDARIVAREAEPGETVVTRLQTSPLLIVASRNEMVARAQVAQAQLAGLPEGQSIAVQIGGREYSGRVRRIGLEPVGGREGEALYPLDVVFPVPDEADLRAGQRATLVVP